MKGNIKVPNIIFDGAGIQGEYSFVWTNSFAQSFEKCNFINCIAKFGPALQITNGDAYISDCHFSNNEGQLAGAHLAVCGRKATIENCTFTGGYVSDDGSVYIGTTEETSMTGCTISRNAAGKQGGGIYVYHSMLNIVARFMAIRPMVLQMILQRTTGVVCPWWTIMPPWSNYISLMGLFPIGGP